MVDISSDLFKIREQLSHQLQHSVTRQRETPAMSPAPLSAPTAMVHAGPPAPPPPPAVTAPPMKLCLASDVACPVAFGLDDLRSSLRSKAELIENRPMEASSAEIRSAVAHYGTELETLRDVVGLYERCVVGLRATLDQKLAEEIAGVNSEIRREETQHRQRVTELSERARTKEEERLAHLSSMMTLQESVLQRQEGRPVFDGGGGGGGGADEMMVLGSSLHDRLENFYQSYNKAKLPTVRETLLQYGGREAELFATLVAKYGPEPPAIVCVFFFFWYTVTRGLCIPRHLFFFARFT